MIDLKLIDSCYSNIFGIDLKSFHRQKFEDCEAELSPEVLNRPILFEDYKSKSFELIVHDGMIYLLGDRSCYPCSPLVRSVYGIHWVPIILLPSGEQFRTENDIRNSGALYMNDFINVLNEIDDKLILMYLEKFSKSFFKNSWFSSAFHRKVITTREFSFDFIYQYLKENHLLTMFELSLMSILKNDELNYKNLLYSLNFDNIPSKSYSFVSFLAKEFRLSKSLKEIVKSDDFLFFLKSLSNKELYDFFEVDFIYNHIFIDKITDENLLDIFQIDIVRRYYNPTDPNRKGINEVLDELNITKPLLSEFNSRILKNIRNLENTIRKNKGYPEIGGIYRELIVFNFFSEKLSNYTVTAQFSPKWLGRQRFDVYIHELNIAIEYNGKQHYESIDFFGGKDGLILNIKRDKIKEEKCISNNCKFYVIRYDEDIKIRMNEILHDIRAFEDVKLTVSAE
ncbi:hypothetical protein ABE545_23080 [Sphingobacterium faecium]|uniref:hypothetical protein n=1 Tax=Sphingobacterium faecium TaxID=34087 RepID=UPI0032099BA5